VAAPPFVAGLFLFTFNQRHEYSVSGGWFTCACIPQVERARCQPQRFVGLFFPFS
jgi:hypothetical protein